MSEKEKSIGSVGDHLNFADYVTSRIVLNPCADDLMNDDYHKDYHSSCNLNLLAFKGIPFDHINGDKVRYVVLESHDDGAKIKFNRRQFLRFIEDINKFKDNLDDMDFFSEME